MEGRRHRRKLDRELDCFSSRSLKCRRRLTLTSPASLEDLPEDLLHKVISGLTVKEAGRTSILSSRWRKRWTYHSNLCFDGTSSEFAGYDTDKFVDHVNTVLQQHSRMTVDKFELRSPPVLGKEDSLGRWFGFATATKARQVTVDFSPLLFSKHQVVPSPIKYKLPADQLVGTNFTIVSLFLGYVCLELPPVSNGSLEQIIGFKTLKKLELQSIVDLGDLTPFIANCPALECLSISNSRIHHQHLVVPDQARCLGYLRLERVINLRSIHLNATSLTTFEYIRCPSVPIKTNTALKLSQANIQVYRGLDTVRYFWDELCCWLAPVHHLILTLSMYTKITRLIYKPTKFIHLRYLKLFCNILGDPDSALVILRLTQIIESAQQLEHFVLDMYSFDARPLILKTPTSIHPHVHHHLKTVQMTGVVGLSGQLELAKYILLSADALEFMTLELARSRNRLVPSQSDYTYFTRFEEFAKNHLDPKGVYRDILEIVGLRESRLELAQ